MLPWLLWNAIMWIEWMSHFYGREVVVACEFPLCIYSMWSASASDVLDGMNIKKIWNESEGGWCRWWMMKMNVFILYKSAIFVHVNWVDLDKKKNI